VLAQFGGLLVGEGEQPAAAAPVLGERVDPGRTAVHTAEMAGELVDVRGRRTAPAVDRLAGVADRGDGVAAPALRIRAAEQRGEHPALRHRRVLILVEQHHPVLGPLDVAHLGDLLGSRVPNRHLVAEVHQIPARLQPAVLLDQAEHSPRSRDLPAASR